MHADCLATLWHVRVYLAADLRSCIWIGVPPPLLPPQADPVVAAAERAKTEAQELRIAEVSPGCVQIAGYAGICQKAFLAKQSLIMFHAPDQWAGQLCVLFKGHDA